MNTQTYPMDSTRTLSGLFHKRVELSTDKLAYQYFENEQWRQKTWRDIAEDAVIWQQIFKQYQLKSGDKVAIMLKNSHDWVSFDQAALGLGIVTVPLFYNDRADNAAYIIDDSDSKLLFIGESKICQEILDCNISLLQLKHIVTLNDMDSDDARIDSLPAIWHIANQKLPENTITDPDTLATIVYTSGTTGRPKGVMLSHKNILSNVKSVYKSADFSGKDHSFLSFLPLSHMLERTGGYYFAIYIDASVSFTRSILLLGEDLQALHPTVLVSVPRIYERIYAKIKDELSAKPAIIQKLFALTLRVGNTHFEYKQGRAAWQPKLLLKPLLDTVVSKKIINKLGGNLQFAICGGASLSQAVADLFIGIGLPMYQGYGLTECSPLAAVNRPDSNIPISIGLPAPDVELRIAEDDELQIKGNNVMLGYWKNEQATADTMTEDGWLRSGDKARFDERGHAYIIGRLKEIIVMSNGEKVPPVSMELDILTDTLFDQLLIIGEQKPFLSALVVLNAEKQQAINDTDVLRRMNDLLVNFPAYAKIRKISIINEPWTVENGLLTPTLKIKRSKVIKHCAKQINAIYEGHLPT